MYRSAPLEIKELMALIGSEGRDGPGEDGTSEDYDLDSDCSEEGASVRGVRSSVSLEIHGLQREQHVHFSNQEYYRRLEELKSAHLRNMAELERMYISQDGGRREEEEGGGLRRGRSREARRTMSGTLQRINSQEELDFHDTSSGSDQFELCGGDSPVELDLDHPRRTLSLDRAFRRNVLLSPEDTSVQKQFRFQPENLRPPPQGGLSRQSGVRVRSSSKVTVPKPFKMMLREEERKKHRVRTRSEIELENTLLRQELEELRECRKQFRASPAPAHTRLPLYETISRRPSQRNPRSRTNGTRCKSRSVRARGPSPQPFHFLERERKKKEAKIVAELGNLGQRDERAFKARPVPGSVYGTRPRTDSRAAARQPGYPTTRTLEREDGLSDPNSDLEPDGPRSGSDVPMDQWTGTRPSSKSGKKHIELSIEMVKERDRSNPI